MDRRYGSFVWDVKKEWLNIAKHGVDFEMAARAFLDPRHRVYQDVKHSAHEPRFFCLGRVGQRVLTVRFLNRSGLVRIIGAGYWRKGERYYAQGD